MNSRNQGNSVRKTIEKIRDTKSGSLKKVKMNKPLARLVKIKRQDTNHYYQE